jgi:glycine oxidase
MAISSKQPAAAIIVGGGIIGLTIARALARRGLRDVTLLEKGQTGAEASWAAGGILAPQVEADREDDFFRLARASRDMYPDFAQALEAESGIDVELDATGTLYLAFTELEEKELQARCQWQRSAGLKVDWWSTDEVLNEEPNLAPNIRGALQLPADWQIENRRLAAALLSANEKLGIEILTGCEVNSLSIEHGRIAGVETSAGRVEAALVIVAAGAWTSLIEPPCPFKIEPVRGQMICYKSQTGFARHVIYSSNGYLVPRRDGRILAGSTTEAVGFDKRVTKAGIAHIQSMALEIIPALAKLPLADSWAGFRPRAADGLPVIGPWDGIEGLVFATGHYRNGILLAPITGELVAQVVIDAKLPPLLAPFSPNRFLKEVNPSGGAEYPSILKF